MHPGLNPFPFETALLAGACNDDGPTSPTLGSARVANLAVTASDVTLTGSRQQGFESSFSVTISETAGVEAAVQTAVLTIRDRQTGTEELRRTVSEVVSSGYATQIVARGRLDWSETRLAIFNSHGLRRSAATSELSFEAACGGFRSE